MFEFSIMLTIKICNLNFIHFLLKKMQPNLVSTYFDRMFERFIYKKDRLNGNNEITNLSNLNEIHASGFSLLSEA